MVYVTLQVNNYKLYGYRMFCIRKTITGNNGYNTILNNILIYGNSILDIFDKNYVKINNFELDLLYQQSII